MESKGIHCLYMKNIKVDIKEPMRDGSVGIRSAFVENAIKYGVGLEITTPKGTSVVDPIVWKAKSRIMKMEGKYPGNPMIMYCGWVDTHSSPEHKNSKKVTTTTVTTIVIEEVQTKLL
jgi:hypothetical protein